MRIEKKITLLPEEVKYIASLLSAGPASQEECFGEDETIMHTAIFGNGMEMDIKLCGVQYEDGGFNKPWTEAMLFKNGTQVACTEPDETYLGEWCLKYDGNEYVTCVETALRGCPFCGNKNITTGRSFFGGMHSFSCGICKISVQFQWEDRDKCIDVWNSRTDKEVKLCSEA